jgi:hypothetical protein
MARDYDSNDIRSERYMVSLLTYQHDRKPTHSVNSKGNSAGWYCPACGTLPNLTVGIQHAVRNQFDVPPAL